MTPPCPAPAECRVHASPGACQASVPDQQLGYYTPAERQHARRAATRTERAAKDAVISVIDHAPETGAAAVLAGGGEMGALMRGLDWARTPLGPVDGWPQSLRTVASVCLSSRFPMLLLWGPELVMLYNDAYRPILGTSKHPAAMGQRGRQCWPEIWDLIGPMLEGVLATGQATWSDDQLLLLDRNGYVEECYFTFSYSPIRDETGGVGGVFTAVTETTGRVLGERRLRTLRELASRMVEARGVEAVYATALATLATNAADLPFAALYLPNAAGVAMRLAGSAGLDVGLPTIIDESNSAAPIEAGVTWALAQVARTGQSAHVENLTARLVASRGTAESQHPGNQAPQHLVSHGAMVLPVAQLGQQRPAALLVAGVSPRRTLDDDYRGFFELVAGQIANAIADARAYEEEHRRAEALAELDRAKTAFFSNISHEFRTPLTLALGPIEEMLAGTLAAPVRERLELAHRNHLRLLKLVNTLMDFARIEAGRVQACYQPTDLAALTADLASVFRSAAERAGMRLLVDCPPLPEPIYVDREMWEKIVLNLLSNAMKHTFEGEIAVVLRATEGHVALEVRDTGTGIAAEEVPRLFERFHRIRDARARTHEGAGIGLALVQELVRLHGGTVRVESAVGKGTCFTVTLPLGVAHLPPDQLGPAGSEPSRPERAVLYLEEATRWSVDTAEMPGAALDIASAGAGALPLDWMGYRRDSAAVPARPRVLLADDNADMRGYLGSLLAGTYDVRAVGDGAAALAAARAQVPDLILADVMMPELDGFALLRALRADPATREIPVMLLSARAGEESAIEALHAGADDYLVKPFSARELLARVRGRIELANLRARAAAVDRALLAAAEAEQGRLHEIFQQAPVMTAVLRGPEHVFEIANALYEQGTGRSAGELLGRSVRAAFPELAGQGWYELLDEVYRSGMPTVGTETPARIDRAGAGILDDIYFTFTYQPMRDAAGAVWGIVVTAVDVTTYVQARQQGEELARQLRDERDRLQQVLDVIPEAILIADTTPRFIVVNQAAREILGVDVVGQPVPMADPDAHTAFGARHIDGTPYTSKDLPLERALLHNEVVQGDQFLLRNAQSGRDVPVLANAAPLRDVAGAVTGGVVVFQDITAIRDLEQMREEFLSSAAHDLKTPLTTIRGHAELAQRRLARMSGPDIAPLLRRLVRIQDGTDTILGLINQLLDVSRQQMGGGLDLRLQPTDLVALVRGCVEVQREASGRPITLETDLPELLGDLDTARITRVLGNLISNALKYSPAGRPILVRLARHAGKAGPEALIAVSDWGIGIPAADQPYIFDRFRRASNVVGRIQGTGIGLASALGIVEQHGGTIAVESSEGEGATFRVRLPLAQ